MGVLPRTDLYAGHRRWKARPNSSSSTSASVRPRWAPWLPLVHMLGLCTMIRLSCRESSLGHPKKNQGEASCSDRCQAKERGAATEMVDQVAGECCAQCGSESHGDADNAQCKTK